MRIKRFNETWNPFKKDVPNVVDKITSKLELDCKEKTNTEVFHVIDKDGWGIVIKNVYQMGPNGVEATVTTGYNGFIVDRNIRVGNLEEFLSNFDFSPKDGKMPMRGGAHP